MSEWVGIDEKVDRIKMEIARLMAERDELRRGLEECLMLVTESELCSEEVDDMKRLAALAARGRP